MNKYKETLNELFNAVKGTLDIKLFKDFDLLDELIREYENQNEVIFKLSKALDKSLDMYFRKGTYLFPSKEALKKYLLKEELENGK